MNAVHKWAEDERICNKCILVVSLESKELYLEFANEYEYKPVATCFYSENVSELGVLLFLRNRFGDINTIENFTTESVNHFRLLDVFSREMTVSKLCHEQKRLGHELKKAMEDDLEWSGLSQLRSALKIQIALLDNLNTCFFERTTLDPAELQNRSRHWWLNVHKPMTLINELSRHLKLLKKFNTKNSLKGMITVANILKRHYESLGNQQLEFLSYSKYFYVLSKHSLIRGHFDEALLYSHRSLECILFHAGLSSNALSQSADGEIFFSNDRSRKINIPNLSREILPYYQAQHLNRVLNDVNNLRNTSKLTHGVYSIPKGQLVEQIHELLRKLYKEIGESKELERSIIDFSEKKGPQVLKSAIKSVPDFDLLFSWQGEGLSQDEYDLAVVK